jgi:RNA recognition motif-containing protein
MMADNPSQLSRDEESVLSNAFSSVVSLNESHLNHGHARHLHTHLLHHSHSTDKNEDESSDLGSPELGEELDDEDERCLFIGDLARGLTEEQLSSAFESFDVVNVEIKRDRVTNFSLGYGFVILKTREQATAAKKAMHRQMVGGRAIRVGWAQKNTNLFIGDLDPAITSEQLREVFRRFGPLYEEETFVKNRNYGFARFRYRKHAEKAKREMNNQILGSRAIRIGWGDANYQRHCVHIQFDPSESENLTENEVISRFEQFGTVISINMPRNQGHLRGFGFVYYDDTDLGENAASQAIRALNNSSICGVVIQCNYGKKPSSKKKLRQQQKASVRHHGHPLQGMVAGVRGARHPALFPVHLMMPVGPQGSWQPVQYMVTAQQASQIYSYSLPHMGSISPQARHLNPQSELHIIQPAQGPDGRQYWPQVPVLYEY